MQRSSLRDSGSYLNFLFLLHLPQRECASISHTLFAWVVIGFSFAVKELACLIP